MLGPALGIFRSLTAWIVFLCACPCLVLGTVDTQLQYVDLHTPSAALTKWKVWRSNYHIQVWVGSGPAKPYLIYLG